MTIMPAGLDYSVSRIINQENCLFDERYNYPNGCAATKFTINRCNLSGDILNNLRMIAFPNFFLNLQDFTSKPYRNVYPAIDLLVVILHIVWRRG